MEALTSSRSQRVEEAYTILKSTRRQIQALRDEQQRLTYDLEEATREIGRLKSMPSSAQPVLGVSPWIRGWLTDELFWRDVTANLASSIGTAALIFTIAGVTGVLRVSKYFYVAYGFAATIILVTFTIGLWLDSYASKIRRAKIRNLTRGVLCLVWLIVFYLNFMLLNYITT